MKLGMKVERLNAAITGQRKPGEAGDKDKSQRRSSAGLLEGEVDTLNKQVQHSETIDMQVNGHCAEE